MFSSQNLGEQLGGLDIEIFIWVQALRMVMHLDCALEIEWSRQDERYLPWKAGIAQARHSTLDGVRTK